MMDLSSDECIAQGIGSLHEDGRHLLFLDLDDTSIEDAKEIAMRIIDEVYSSDIYIVESSPGNCHIVCLDLFEYDQIRRILSVYGHRDWYEIRSSYGDFVLRIGPKMRFIDGKKFIISGTNPRLVAVVKSQYRFHDMSRYAKNILGSLWRYNIPNHPNYKTYKMRFHIYRMRWSQ